MCKAMSITCESTANLKSFGRWDGKHGVCHHCLELIEARLSQASRYIATDAGYHPANAVFVLFGSFDHLSYTTN